jgi:hypothetical protein
MENIQWLELPLPPLSAMSLICPLLTGLKGQLHENFKLFVFHQTNPLGRYFYPAVNSLANCPGPLYNLAVSPISSSESNHTAIYYSSQLPVLKCLENYLLFSMADSPNSPLYM